MNVVRIGIILYGELFTLCLQTPHPPPPPKKKKKKKKKVTLANREEPDEMQHDAAFHQGMHCLLRLKQTSGTEYIVKKLLPVTPLNTK